MSTAQDITPTQPTQPEPRRRPGRRRNVIGAAAVVVAAVIFAVVTGWIGRSEVTQVPAPSAQRGAIDAAAARVNWSQYRAGFRSELEADDCRQLETAYVAAGATEGLVDAAPLADYIVVLASAKRCVVPDPQ